MKIRTKYRRIIKKAWAIDYKLVSMENFFYFFWYTRALVYKSIY